MCSQGLIDSLYSHWNIPTILQSLGCIAQYSVSTFQTRGEEVTSYICQKIIQVIEFNYKLSCLFNLFGQHKIDVCKCFHLLKLFMELIDKSHAWLDGALG